MKSKTLIASFFIAAFSLFVIRVAAQHAVQSQGGMMSPDMMTQHQQMMSQHQDLGKLIDQLNKSFAALENEKDPAVLKNKLAEHGELLKQLQTKFQQSAGMMGMTGQMMEHSMMMQHGEQAMGFSQTQTTHHFFLTKDGGVIQVEANDPKDTQNRDVIRRHLTHITQVFASDDFSALRRNL